MADHLLTKNIEIRTKAAITRAWTDLEPKVAIWLASGGLLSAVNVALHYYGVINVPYWVPIVVTYLGGFLAAYFKKTTVRVPSVADGEAAANTAVTAGIAAYVESGGNKAIALKTGLTAGANAIVADLPALSTEEPTEGTATPSA